MSNISMAISPNNKRKHEAEEENPTSRQKWDTQILHDVEAAWLTDPVATEQTYVQEYTECDSESSKLCLALIGVLNGNAESPYTPEELLEECSNPLKHDVLAWKATLLIDSLTTPLCPSYFDGKTFTEVMDANILETLLQSDVLRSNRAEDSENGCWDFLKMMKLTEEATQLTKLRNNQGKTTYTISSHGYGMDIWAV